MPEAAALLERIDRAIAELLAVRAEIAGVGEVSSTDPIDLAADFAAEHLIEISTAVERFNRPADTLRWLCRKQSCGVKYGGRWMVSAPRLARYLNGGE